MLSRHLAEVDGIGIFASHSLSISLVVSEAILHTNNDPAMLVWNRKWSRASVPEICEDDAETQCDKEE